MKYEKLKKLTRGEKLTPQKYQDFIKSLSLKDKNKSKLLALTPSNYTGVASTLVEKFLKENPS